MPPLVPAHADAQPEVNALLEKPLFVSLRRARAITSLGNTTLWAMIKDGRLATRKVGRRRLIIYSSLEALAKTDAEPS